MDVPTTAGSDLLQRIARRDPAAFQECIDRYGGLIWNLACRLSPTTADAEHATQAIFLTVWQDAPRFDAAVGGERAFVMALARQHLTATRHPSASSLPAPPASAPSASASATAAPSTPQSIDGDRALQVLHTLQPDCRQVLCLVIEQGLTQSEVARQLSVSLDTVKRCLRGGLLQVQARLPADDTSVCEQRAELRLPAFVAAASSATVDALTGRQSLPCAV